MNKIQGVSFHSDQTIKIETPHITHTQVETLKSSFGQYAHRDLTLDESAPDTKQQFYARRVEIVKGDLENIYEIETIVKLRKLNE